LFNYYLIQQVRNSLLRNIFMIKRIITQLSLGLVCVISSHAVCAGELFSVTSTGTPAIVEIILCLNGEAQLSCQKYMVSALDLQIHTVANHSYPAAGIKVNTPGFTLPRTEFDCRTNNGFCLFPVNNIDGISFSLTDAFQDQFTQNFDDVTAPSLPSGWTAETASEAGCGDNTLWINSTTDPETPPNAAFINDPSCVTDAMLESPDIMMPNFGSMTLTFSNNYNLETNYDGGVLEISIPNVNAGAFRDIILAGGVFIEGGYNTTISSCCGNPISGRNAWSGNSGGYITTVVTLPSSAIGQLIKLRWRRATDSSVSRIGWFIDTIFITR
jgi:hypothetical protein